MSAPTMMSRLVAAMNHPEHGWKSTHFWGPIANWGLVGAAVYDANYKGPESIDIEMTGTMMAYSLTFLGFAWQVNPRNYLLFSCHVFNMTAQLNQLRRAINYKVSTLPNAEEELSDFKKKFAAGCVAIGALVAAVKPTKAILAHPAIPQFIKVPLLHPAGPLTVFFWAPASKWLFSINNLKDLEKPTDKISIPQMGALAATGFIWTRYSFVITPVNLNLAAVNFTLGCSSGYHLYRKIKADYGDKKAEKV